MKRRIKIIKILGKDRAFHGGFAREYYPLLIGYEIKSGRILSGRRRIDAGIEKNHMKGIKGLNNLDGRIQVSILVVQFAIFIAIQYYIQSR